MEYAKLINNQQPVFSIGAGQSTSTITLHTGAEAMLEVKADGFYVRGVKLEQDEHEARQVYESFKAWLAWAHLTKTN